eukprot:604301-Pleurochrysis_carterae.AAC.1
MDAGVTTVAERVRSEREEKKNKGRRWGWRGEERRGSGACGHVATEPRRRNHGKRAATCDSVAALALPVSHVCAEELVPAPAPAPLLAPEP